MFSKRPMAAVGVYLTRHPLAEYETHETRYKRTHRLSLIAIREGENDASPEPW